MAALLCRVIIQLTSVLFLLEDEQSVPTSAQWPSWLYHVASDGAEVFDSHHLTRRPPATHHMHEAPSQSPRRVRTASPLLSFSYLQERIAALPLTGLPSFSFVIVIIAPNLRHDSLDRRVPGAAHDKFATPNNPPGAAHER